jgi:hypothetical protein
MIPEPSLAIAFIALILLSAGPDAPGLAHDLIAIITNHFFRS